MLVSAFYQLRLSLGRSEQLWVADQLVLLTIDTRGEECGASPRVAIWIVGPLLGEFRIAQWWGTSSRSIAV